MEPNSKKLKIAVIGGGISGITAAYLLSREHDVTLFEKEDYLGGHTNTRLVRDNEGREQAVDTGFIVCNPKNYPNFYKLLKIWGVELQDSNMSFGFFSEESGLNYVGPSPKEFMRTWWNFLSPRFLYFILEQSSFNSQLRSALFREELQHLSLGDYLKTKRHSKFLIENYLAPLIGSIWSGPAASVDDFPAKTLARFFENHDMLRFGARPTWQTIKGGSQEYIKAFKSRFTGRILLSCPVVGVERSGSCQVRIKSGENLSFDRVVFASHADQTIKLLSDASAEEAELLSCWKYESNETVLHRDISVLPPNRQAWAAWNYYKRSGPASTNVAITYYMNRLQNLKCSTDFFVSLNRSAEIPSEKRDYQIHYTHPVMNMASVKTQPDLKKLNGINNSYFCGAYCGYGFHEDGVNSGLEVAKHFGISL